MKAVSSFNLPGPHDPLGASPREQAERATEAHNNIWASLWANQRPHQQDIIDGTGSRTAIEYMLDSFQTRLYQLNDRLERAEAKARKYDALVEAFGDIGTVVAGALRGKETPR